MTKSKIFVWLSLSFVFGLFFGSRFNLVHFFVLILLAFCATCFGTFFITKFFWRKIALLSTACLFFAGLGILRIQINQAPNEYASVFDSKPSMEGYIVEDVDIRTDKQLITFQPKGQRQRILITTSKYQEYFYGDWLSVEGKIAEPKNFDDFDYQKYLQRYNIYAVMSYPKILILKNNQQSAVKYSLLKIKYAFSSRISNFLTEPQASLLLGILIGARKTLPQNIIDNFNNTGLSHIVAVSGFNITIIISALGFLARFLGRRASFWLSLLVIFGFVIITGASASVLRAAVMGGLLLLSFNIGRQYSVTPALFLAAIAMLVVNPRILYWDVGFQLSFAATCGIVYFAPLLERLTYKWPNPLELKNIFISTISAILVTLPLILFYFGRLSLVAPLVNVLVLPFLPITMLLGFLIAVPFLGSGFAFVTNWLLVYILKIVEYFASLSFASLGVQLPVEIFVASLFALLLGYFLFKHLAGRIQEEEMLDKV